MDYKFIDENNKNEEKKYEENIEKCNEEISGIDEKIKELRVNMSISPKERQKQKSGDMERGMMKRQSLLLFVDLWR